MRHSRGRIENLSTTGTDYPFERMLLLLLLLLRRPCYTIVANLCSQTRAHPTPRVHNPPPWQIKKLQLSPAGTSSRKKSVGGAGGRKSALKKSKGGTRAVKSDGGKRRGGAASALSAAIGNVYGKTKTAGALAWGARNLFFFAAAVAAMHRHGDYLAV